MYGRNSMPPRNHSQWLKQPKVEYISSECYNSHDVYLAEQEYIFNKVWVPMCHMSEMYELGNFRTTTIAGVPVIAVNTNDGIKAYRDTHITHPAGTLSGPIEGVELYCEVKHGQMVWVTLDPNPTMDVEQWTAGAFDCIADAIDTEELEVFHYHKAIIDTNYKLCMIQIVNFTPF